jgi:hypothetical protein
MEKRTIRLTLEDGKELVCEVISLFTVDNQEYIAVLEPEKQHVLLYRFSEDEQGPELENIMSDEEFESVEKAFREIEEKEHQHSEHEHHDCCDHDHEDGGCCDHDHGEDEECSHDHGGDESSEHHKKNDGCS